MPQRRWYDLFLSMSSICRKYDNTKCEGYDQIDVDACLRHKIALTYAPDPVKDATADLTMFLLLGAIRKLNPELLASVKTYSRPALTSGMIPKGRHWGF
jgi:glyoxylate reductase